MGRDTLPVTMWSQLDATPYGHFNKMMSGAGANADPQTAKKFASHVNMDHYKVQGATLTNSELPRPKRTFANQRR